MHVDEVNGDQQIIVTAVELGGASERTEVEGAAPQRGCLRHRHGAGSRQAVKTPRFYGCNNPERPAGRPPSTARPD